jgi:excisionase family DNA binding protein
MEQTLSTTEVAKCLDVTENTVYRYIKEKKLQPINEHFYRIHTTYLFKLEEVERLRKELEKPGLTIKQAAQKLGVSYSTIKRSVDDGQLPAIQKRIGSRVISFIKGLGYGLFQSFFNPASKETARIMSIEGKGEVLTDTRQFHLLALEKKGFTPLYELKSEKYVTHKGYVKFQFPKANFIHALGYKIIDKLYDKLGIQNMNLEIDEGTIKLTIKPVHLQLDDNEIEFVRKYLIEGQVKKNQKGDCFITSNFEPLLIHLPSHLKEELKYKTEQEKMTMEEALTKLVEWYVSEGSMFDGK